MPTLKELVEYAKTLEYQCERINDEDWLDDDYLFHSIYDFLRDDKNVKSVSIITKLFPPIIIVFKTFIKRYIKLCEKQKEQKNQNIAVHA